MTFFSGTKSPSSSGAWLSRSMLDTESHMEALPVFFFFLFFFFFFLPSPGWTAVLSFCADFSYAFIFT
jgi:hypothetical protein